MVNDRASRSVDGTSVLHRAAFSFQLTIILVHQAPLSKCQPLALLLWHSTKHVSNGRQWVTTFPLKLWHSPGMHTSTHSFLICATSISPRWRAIKAISLSQSTCCSALRPFLGTSAYTACPAPIFASLACNSLQHCLNIKTVMIPCIRSVTTGSYYRKPIAELTLCFVRFISLRRF